MNSEKSTFQLIKRATTLGLTNIWRNKLPSLATIFVIGTMLFIFNIMLNIQHVATTSLSEIGQKIDIHIYLKESTDEDDAKDIINVLEKQNGIKAVTYTSKEDALKRLKLTQPDLSTAFEKYNLENPLPASINIQVESPAYFEEINTFLSQDKFASYFALWDKNENNSITDSITTNLSNISIFVRHIIFWLIITLIIGGSLIIYNAIKITIHNRKQEIQIMKLVGAPYWFIRLPFIVESIIYVILAIALSSILFHFLINQINLGSTSLFQHFQDLSLSSIIITEALITGLIAIISSTLSLEKTLKSRISATHQ